ncbi:hypothetical protein PMZ80_010436 [Knufia obscura]|uniref:FAD dependent oxidoreductase domain-containing protein n=2 Tax=Knufia TaxID=430999 RepID=A0AAN8E7N8_9EURO|nr:hypothetical protein PMZ80_010436 [Knufia obscura]KAK5948029.1 hypothetical protein OHC33_010957 [Knufia fluminis]
MESTIPVHPNLTLRMWRDLTPLPFPLRPANKTSPHVLIIGGGWASIVDHITSQIAGALWEYPPAVCGQHEGKVSLEESKRWSMVSYHCYAAIAEDPELAKKSGIEMKQGRFYFPTRLEDDHEQYCKMQEIMASGVKGFRRYPSFDLENQNVIAKNQKIEDMYEIDSPMIDSDQGMQWLMKLVQDKGGLLRSETIHGALLEQESELLERFQADVIVNATGLGAQELAGDDTCYPVRGALVRVVNDGLHFPRVTQAHTVSADVSGAANEIVFIVPRSDNTLLLGGIAEDKVGDTNLILDSPVIKEMRQRCVDFIPLLENAKLHPSYPLAVGLRPFRGGNVRVERELRKSAKAGNGKPSRIVHSYGQGGAGWTLAFGCAADICTLVEEAIADAPPRSLADDATKQASTDKEPKHDQPLRARL